MWKARINSPMKIGISAEWVGQKVGGPETYDYNLVKALGEIDGVNKYCLYGADPAPFMEWLKLHPNFSCRSLRTNSRWLIIPFLLPWELFRHPIDLFHATFVVPPVCPGKVILTVHDISWEIHPEYFPANVRFRLSWLTRLGVVRAQKIIAATEATKRDLISCYKVPSDKIIVTHYGINQRFASPRNQQLNRTVLEKKYGIAGDFLLYVGRFHIRKNLPRLLQAFASVKRESPRPIRLVLAGSEMWNATPLAQTIEQLQLQEDVRCLGYVPDQDLPVLYQEAKLLVYPSIYEGFGFPPLEAMSCGTPVVTSNRSSLPEVVGDGALLVNPFDVAEIAESILKVLKDDDLRNRLIAKGFENVKRFSWQTTAQQTINVYQEVLAGP